MLTVPPQLSVAVAEPVFAGAVESPHCNCLSGGQVITGGVVSTKVMCWTQVAMLPQLSVAVQVRSMPALPVQLAGVGASLKVMPGSPPQLSVAVARPVLLGSVESPHCNCLSGGQVITGSGVSTKVMCWTQVAMLPQPSVAGEVRSMPALPVQLAEVGASAKVMAGLPPQLSVAVARPVLLGSVESPHCNCLSGGQVITGAVVSLTRKLWLQVREQPLL